MMRISFPTAKLACEKGYKAGCDKCYTAKGTRLWPPCYGNLFKNGDDNDDCMYEAPYQAELQEWLRNERKIHIIVMQSNLPMTEPQTDEWEWGFDIFEVNYPASSLCLSMGYATYEDALEAGLIKALNIIK